MKTEDTPSEGEPLLHKSDSTPSENDTILLLGSDDETTEKSQERFGYLLILCSALCYTSTSLFVRMATMYHTFPVCSVALFMGMELAVVALVYIAYVGDLQAALRFSHREVFLINLRGLFGALAMFLFIGSLRFLPLGVQTSVYFLNPIFTIFLASRFLGESFGVRELIAAVLSFLGVVLVSNPSLNFDFSQLYMSCRGLGCAMAMGAALSASCAFVTMKAYSANVHYMYSVLSLGVWASVFGVMSGGANVTLMGTNPTGCALIIVGGTIGVLAQCLMNKGLEFCRAGTGTMIRNVDVPISFVLGLIFLGEMPHAVSLVGSAVIISSTIIVSAGRFSD